MANSATAALRDLSGTLGPEVASVLRTGAEGLPRSVAREIEKAAKDVAFSKSANVGLLWEAAVRLAMYGRLDSAVRLAQLLVQVPFTGNQTLFEPVRRSVHIAMMFASAAEDDAAVAALSPFVHLPEGWQPNVRRLEGRMLKLPLDERERWEKAGPRYLASAILTDVAELATMWVCGGSRSWPRQRIEAQVATYRSALGDIPGYEPAS